MNQIAQDSRKQKKEKLLRRRRSLDNVDSRSIDDIDAFINGLASNMKNAVENAKSGSETIYDNGIASDVSL